MNAFNNLDHTQASGVRLGGQKFVVVKADPRSIYGKKQVRRSPATETFTFYSSTCTSHIQCLVVSPLLRDSVC